MSSIWCNEPWVGLDATGPWGTEFDSYTTAKIAAFRQQCSSVPKRAEPRALWRLPASSSRAGARAAWAAPTRRTRSQTSPT